MNWQHYLKLSVIFENEYCNSRTTSKISTKIQLKQKRGVLKGILQKHSVNPTEDREEVENNKEQ